MAFDSRIFTNDDDKWKALARKTDEIEMDEIRPYRHPGQDRYE